MEINLYLATPSAEKSAVVLSLHHNGKRYKKSTGITIPVRSWSKVRQRTNIIPEQARLDTIVRGVTEYIEPSSSAEKVEAVLSRIRHGVFSEEAANTIVLPSFMEFYTEWKERPCAGVRQHRTRYKAFCEMMGRECRWEDFNMPMYMRLCDRMNERGFSINYQGTVIKDLKAVLNEGLKRGYHENTRFQLWKKMHEETFSIALTPEDMDRLWYADGLTAHEAKIRDLAWVAYLTASRFSDYSHFTTDNISGDRFTFVPHKTDSPVSIPCSPKIREIMARNGGGVPRISEQKFNDGVKELCHKVGINDIIQVPRSKRTMLGWSMDKVVEKWELVSSHTFRRSGASALYRAGVPAKIIRFLTGHKSDKTLFLYIKLNAEDGYQSLAGLEFFK